MRQEGGIGEGEAAYPWRNGCVPVGKMYKPKNMLFNIVHSLPDYDNYISLHPLKTYFRTVFSPDLTCKIVHEILSVYK